MTFTLLQQFPPVGVLPLRSSLFRPACTPFRKLQLANGSVAVGQQQGPPQLAVLTTGRGRGSNGVNSRSHNWQGEGQQRSEQPVAQLAGGGGAATE